MTLEELRKLYVKSYEEFYKALNSKLKSINTPRAGFKHLLIAKLNAAHTTLINEVSSVIRVLEKLDSLHGFYVDLFALETGSKPRELIPVFQAMKRRATIIYRKYLELLKSSENRAELVENFRVGLARLLSVYKRRRKLISKIKTALSELAKLPDTTGDYVVVIAGMPQVGKSTLLSKLTRAKPEISPFPFTTKTVIVGHLNIEPYGKITIIDTPGLLDRPIDEKNPIELKAVLAIKHLTNLLLYIIDPNPHGYYTLDEQLRVFESVKSILGGREFLILVNKIDATPPDTLNTVIELLESKYGLKPLPISALRGDNLDYLKKILVEKFMAKTQHRV